MYSHSLQVSQAGLAQTPITCYSTHMLASSTHTQVYYTAAAGPLLPCVETGDTTQTGGGGREMVSAAFHTGADIIPGTGTFSVNPRFHPTEVARNMGLTKKFPTCKVHFAAGPHLLVF